MINENKVFQSIHYPLPTKVHSTAPIIIMNNEIISKTMMVLQKTNPLPPNLPPLPPPMVVSPTASPLWLKKPPTKKLRCTTSTTNNNKGRVYFGNDVTLAYIETSGEITKEEKDNRWYQSIELESFKQSARSLCRERILRSQDIKENNNSNNNEDEDDNSNSSDSIQSQSQNQNDQTQNNQVELLEENNNAADNSEIEIVDSLRGMGAYFPSRVRYCKKYIKHVLVAYHVKCGPTNKENVAYLATKWSRKNQQRAVETGRNDFCAAYDISMPIQENIE